MAREQGWHPFHVVRVVMEYKRFLYLCATQSVPMTPSHAVDQVWHLHLTYTRSYWERLCRDVLPGPLHHHPTQGGRRERAKFHHWYERTIAAYRQAFGTEPPADIWPPTYLRSGADAHPCHVDTRRCWVIPKPWAWLDEHRGALVAATALAAGALLLLGCSEAVDDAIMIFKLLLAFLVVGIYLVSRDTAPSPSPRATRAARRSRRSRRSVRTASTPPCPRHGYHEVVDDRLRAAIEQRPCLCDDDRGGDGEDGDGGDDEGDSGDGCGGCGGCGD